MNSDNHKKYFDSIFSLILCLITEILMHEFSSSLIFQDYNKELNRWCRMQTKWQNHGISLYHGPWPNVTISDASSCNQFQLRQSIFDLIFWLKSFTKLFIISNRVRWSGKSRRGHKHGVKSVPTWIPTVKLKNPGILFSKSNPELLLHSSYSFWP